MRSAADSRTASPPAWALRWAPWAPWASAAVLLASLRGSLPGVAVADDYAFLFRQRFQHPLDLFDSMGAAFYWRPFSRQAWFSAVGPWLLRAPWLAAALSAGLLAALALLLYRITRRLAPDRPWLAWLICASPFLGESSRALLVWPSGVQHLLAAAAGAWAIHEASCGRRVRSALAALLAVLSHELAIVVLPVLPIVAARAASERRTPWVALACGVGLVWLAGYRIALGHGIQLPPGADPSTLAHVPATAALTFMAMIGAEDARAAVHLPIVAASLVAAGAALVTIARERGRGAPTLILALSLLAVFPLAPLSPSWNAWRAFVPVVGLGVGLTMALARGGASWAAAFVALRLIALACAEPAHAHALASPATVSEISYRRLVRMQYLVDRTRQVVEAQATHLPKGAQVGHWDLPLASSVGFESDLAVRVWLRDSTARFTSFGGDKVLQRLPDLVIAYNGVSAQPPVAMIPRALETYAQALNTVGHDLERADSLYAAALAAQSPPAAPLSISALRARALIALSEDRITDARAFADRSAGLDGPGNPMSLALDGCVAISEGRLAYAERRLRLALAREPGNPIAADGLAHLDAARRAYPPQGARP